MFASMVSALQGGGTEDDDEVEEELQSSDIDREGHEGHASDSANPAGRQVEARTGFDLWNLTNTMAQSVKQTASEFAASVRDTDWKAELSAFGSEVKKDTQKLSENTVQTDGAKHLAEDVGGTLAKFGRSFITGTSELFTQVKDVVEKEVASAVQDSMPRSRSGRRHSAAGSSAAGGRYSRLEAEVASMQRDSGTYCDEPEDTGDFNSWKQGFSLEGHKPEIDALIQDNVFMANLQQRVVPLIVEYDDFWTRYFYRLHKLHERHAQMQLVAERAQKAEEEEEVGWDDDVLDTASARADSASAVAAAAPPLPAALHQPQQDGAAGDSTAQAGREEGPAAAQPPSPPPAQHVEDDIAASPAVAAAVATADAAEQAPAAAEGAGSAHKRGESAVSDTSPSSRSSEWCLLSDTTEGQLAGQLPDALAPVEATDDSLVGTPAAVPASVGQGEAGTAADAPVAASASAVPADGPDDEEIDEDWGNWD